MNEKAERRRRRAEQQEAASRAYRRRRVRLAAVLAAGLILIAPIPITSTMEPLCAAGTPQTECETHRELEWVPLSRLVWQALRG